MPRHKYTLFLRRRAVAKSLVLTHGSLQQTTNWSNGKRWTQKTLVFVGIFLPNGPYYGEYYSNNYGDNYGNNQNLL